MLAGRDAERAAIAALLDAARAGTGGSLVVRGVAGSGKSALLTDALTAASDMRVLRTSGVESESPLAFAALQRLLWPLRARLEALPAPQAAALRAALGEAAGEGDRFLAFLGTLSLLADAAEDAPVLAVVDDGQHRARRRLGGGSAVRRPPAAGRAGGAAVRRPRRRGPRLRRPRPAHRRPRRRGWRSRRRTAGEPVRRRG